MRGDSGHVEVSRKTEEHILEAIKSRNSDAVLQQAGVKKVGKVGCPVLACAIARAILCQRPHSRRAQVWDELRELGFSEEDTASAIRATPVMALGDCLDWLCLNLHEVITSLRLREARLLSRVHGMTGE